MIKYLILAISFIFNLTTTHATTTHHTHCVVGGSIIKKIGGICYLQERSCTTDTGKVGFQCGSLSGDLCVELTTPIEISKLCYEGISQYNSTPQQYTDLKERIKTATRYICPENINNKNGCGYLNKSFNELDTRFNLTPKVESPTKGSSSTGADAKTSLEATTRSTEKSSSPSATKVVPTEPAVVAVEPAKTRETGRTKEIIVGNKSGELPVDPVCMNDLDRDPETGRSRQLIIPIFSFSEDNARRCVFARNQKYLAEVATNGCSNNLSKAADELLFTTRIQVSSSGDTQFEDVIVESLITESQTKPTVAGASTGFYTMQFLRPYLQKNGEDIEVILVRENVKIKRTIYPSKKSCKDSRCPIGSCNREGQCEVLMTLDGKSFGNIKSESNIKIQNVTRKNIMPVAQANAEIVRDDSTAKRLVFATNCNISNALKKAGYYQEKTSTPGAQGKQ